MEKIIVGIGEILWDVFPEGKVLGGAPANFAYHASQLGCDGYAVSAVGNDPLGTEVVQSLNEKTLNHILEITPYPTGTVRVKVDGKGGPQYEICENVAWDNIQLTEELRQLAPQTAAVCFGSLAQRGQTSRATILGFLDLVPSTALKVFDINLRQSFFSLEVVEESLRRCNILKINEDEVLVVARMMGRETMDDLGFCRWLHNEFGLSMVILTRGANGSYVIGPHDVSFLDTPRVEVADTVGAGDSFTGAFIASLLMGHNVSEAHRNAVDVSAYVCTQKGAMPLLPKSFVDMV